MSTLKLKKTVNMFRASTSSNLFVLHTSHFDLPVLKSTHDHIPLKYRCRDYHDVRFRCVYLTCNTEIGIRASRLDKNRKPTSSSWCARSFEHPNVRLPYDRSHTTCSPTTPRRPPGEATEPSATTPPKLVRFVSMGSRKAAVSGTAGTRP